MLESYKRPVLFQSTLLRERLWLELVFLSLVYKTSVLKAPKKVERAIKPDKQGLTNSTMP